MWGQLFHTSRVTKENFQDWEKQGLYLRLLLLFHSFDNLDLGTPTGVINTTFGDVKLCTFYI